MNKKKHVLIDSELHKKVKARAGAKGKFLQEELNDIIEKELEVEGENFNE